MADSPLQSVAARNDEIDLIELVQKIWRGRYIVLAVFILGAGLAAAYAFTATQQWTSVAYVVKPEPDQVAGYIQQQRVLTQAVIGLQTDAQSGQAGQTPAPPPVNEWLFTRFVSESAARNNRLTYLSHTSYYAALGKGTGDTTSGRLALANLADKLKVTKPGDAQISPYYKLSFSAHTATQAQKVLSGYLKWVNNQANQSANSVFQSRIQDATLTVQNALDNAELEAKVTRQNEIDRLEHALHTAQLAGIKDNAMVASPAANTAGHDGHVDGGQLFLLGEKLLSAQLASAKQAGPVYPPQYYKAKRTLARLKALQGNSVKATLYAYQLQPTLPVHRDKPRRSLIVLLGAIVGILIGCFLVLVLDAFRSRRRLTPRDA